MRHNAISRRVLDHDNNQTGDEFITENHAIMMYEALLAERTQRDIPARYMP